MEQQNQININPNEGKTIICQSCEGELFDIVHKIKLVPGIKVGSPKDVMVPMQLFICTSCNHILDHTDLKTKE